MLSDKLIDELGLLRLVSKQQAINHKETTETVEAVEQAPTETTAPKLDKHEFRLLVKMLQAINHDCQYDHLEYDGTTVKYHLADRTLVFHDINQPDDKQTINLSSLTDIINNPNLKRPVWEKLKQLKQ
jgi:hypothetical protein